MTEMDDYYMKIGKYAPKPEPEEPISKVHMGGYITGCVLAFVFWIWFIIWIANKL